MPDKVALELASQISNQNLSKEGWTTYYVDGTNGNDGANGLTWNSAFATIQHAIDTAESWAKIYVRAGTYNENVRIDSKQGIHLIGENKYTTIVEAPIGGTALTSSAIVFEDSIESTVTNFKLIAQDYYGVYFVDSDYGIVERCFCFDCYSGVTFNNSNDGVVQNNIIDGNAQTPVAGYGGVRIDTASLRTNVLQNTIHNYDFFGAAIWALADEAIIKDNTIYNIWVGIFVAPANTKCTIAHNNLENITNTYIRDDSGNADAFENYYDVHITDSNNDGITDTPYAYTGGTDYTPVSRRNGWKQVSLGNVAGSSIAEIEANIGDFQAQTNLRTLLDALGIPDVAAKSLYTCLITDRLDNAIYGLSAIETLVDDLETRLTLARAGYLDELAAANIPTDLTNIETKVDTVDTVVDSIQIDTNSIETKIDTVDTVVDAIKVSTDRLAGYEYTGIVSAGTAAETTIKIFDPTINRTEIKSIWLDLTNLVTAGATIKLYHKIDGTNYKVFETKSWALADDDGVLINGFTINNRFKISIIGGEGAGVNIPYNIITQNME